MSKDMNVTIWPLWDNGFGDFYADTPSRRMPTRVDFAVYAKQLTDTELAAEVWMHYWGLMPFIKNGKSNTKGKFERQRILHRFATLPHASANDYE